VLLLVLALVLGLSGCPQWEPPPPKPAPDGVIDIPALNVTFPPAGGSVDFKGKVTCPADLSPCTTAWDFGDGQTSTVESPGSHSYDKLGWYRVLFTASSADRVPDPSPGEAHVAVWNGTFKDDFNRATLGFDASGWRHPILQDIAPYHDLQEGFLRIRGDYHMPGSAALMAYPLVGDCHVEVTKKRHSDPNTDHFTDIVVRMHPNYPAKGTGFIRVRFHEERASVGSYVEIGVFKIFDVSDEHGWLISDTIKQHQSHQIDCLPTPRETYGACDSYDNWPRNQDLIFTVDVKGNRIFARIDPASKPWDGTTECIPSDTPGVPMCLQSSATDDVNTPYLDPGAVGVAQFEGISLLDNFLLKTP
jgi:hypothetical protein